MTDPMNDQKLIDFLKSNFPNPPEASPELEQRILLAIEREEGLSKERNKRINGRLIFPNFSSFSVWLIPPALAASLLVLLSSYHLVKPSEPTPLEEATLEAFVIHNWEGVVGDSPAETQPERELDWYDLPVPPDR